MHPAIRYALGVVTIVTIVDVTVATPTAAAQAAKPDACEFVDAAEVLKLTGREDAFGKGPQVQDPSEIPQYTSGCHFQWDPRPGTFRSVGLVFRSGNKRVIIGEETHSDSIETMKKLLLSIAKTAAPRVK